MVTVLCPRHHWPLCVVCGVCYHAGGSVPSHLFCVLSLTMTTRCWERRETEPQPSSVLATRWQWALLGTRSELGLATSGPCWAERRLRPGEAHTWGGRLAGSERRGGPAPRGTDGCHRLGLSPVSGRRHAGQATRGEGSAWTPGHGKPKSWAQTQYRGNPVPWRRWGGGSETIACPHGGR